MEVNKKSTVLLFNLILHYFLFVFILVFLVRVVGGVIYLYSAGFLL